MQSLIWVNLNSCTAPGSTWSRWYNWNWWQSSPSAITADIAYVTKYVIIITGSQKQNQTPDGSYYHIMMIGLLLIMILLCTAVIYFTQSSADPSAHSYRYVHRYRLYYKWLISCDTSMYAMMSSSITGLVDQFRPTDYCSVLDCSVRVYWSFVFVVNITNIQVGLCTIKLVEICWEVSWRYALSMPTLATPLHNEGIHASGDYSS